MRNGMDALWRAVDRRVHTQIRRIGQPLRGVLTRVTASGQALLVQLAGRAGEVETDLETAELYGLTSAPPVGTEAIAIPIGGSSGHLVVVGQIDRAHRPTDLEGGEVALYNAAGASVRLKADGSVEVTPAEGQRLVLAGGGSPAARVGDTVTPDLLFQAWVAAVSTATAVPAPATTDGVITSGSDLVEVG